MSEKQRSHLERARRRNRRCQGRNRDGGSCGMPALRGSRYCLQHDDTERGEIARASQGRRSRYQLDAEKTPDGKARSSTEPQGSDAGQTDGSSPALGPVR